MTTQTLQQEAVEIQSNSAQITEIALGSQEDVQNFNATLNNFSQTATVSAQESKYIHDSLYTSLAKVDHIIFKHNAYITILGCHEDLLSSFGSHNECRLGRWYEDEGKSLFGDTPSYRSVEAPHSNVHDKVLNTLKCVKSKNCISLDQREMVIENMKSMETSSFILFDLFKTMVIEGNPEVKV